MMTQIFVKHSYLFVLLLFNLCSSVTFVPFQTNSGGFSPLRRIPKDFSRELKCVLSWFWGKRVLCFSDFVQTLCLYLVCKGSCASHQIQTGQSWFRRAISLDPGSRQKQNQSQKWMKQTLS